jgi:hypothetical protein
MNKFGLRALLPAVFVTASTLFSLTSATPAAAYSVISLQGDVGSMTFVDDVPTPGGNCRYGSNGHLNRVSVHDPVLLADQDVGFGGLQWVGFSFLVQQYFADQARYETIYSSSVAKKQAKIDVAAQFDTRTWDIPQSLNRPVRIVVTAKWYQLGSKTAVAGLIKVGVEYYGATKGTKERSVAYRCPPTFPAAPPPWPY